MSDTPEGHRDQGQIDAEDVLPNRDTTETAEQRKEREERKEREQAAKQ